jgi:hypothetical protein
LLDDGFSGSKLLFDPYPVHIDGELLHLRCAEAGKEYMLAWKRESDVAQAVQQQLPDGEFLEWLRKDRLRIDDEKSEGKQQLRKRH